MFVRRMVRADRQRRRGLFQGRKSFPRDGSYIGRGGASVELARLPGIGDCGLGLGQPGGQNWIALVVRKLNAGDGKCHRSQQKGRGGEQRRIRLAIDLRDRLAGDFPK